MGHYLVTGAAGFIGSRVAAQLLAQGHDVLGVDELNDAYDPRVKQHRLAALQAEKGFRFLTLDIAAPASFARPEFAERPFDAVFNLAARAGVRSSVEKPELYVHTNVAGSLAVLELCRRQGIPKLVLASTSSLYGAHNPRPFREDADTSRPLSPYAATKAGAEALAYTYHLLHGLDVTVLRYFTVYGPAGRPDMSVFRFIQWIREGRPIRLYGDGRQSRDFTYVEDIARGTLAALRPVGYEVVNLGSDSPHEINELIAQLEKGIGRSAQVERQPRHPADVVATWADISKAGELLGWRPQVPFEEGLARCVDWYEAERDWARDVSTEG